MVQMSLTGVRQLIAGKSNDLKALEALDKLAGVALLLSPVFAGTAGVAGLALIDPKNELFAQARSAVMRHRRGIPFVERCERMSAAYCLNTFAAFFTALDESLPTVASLLDLKDVDKINLVALVNEHAEVDGDEKARLDRSPLSLPGPVRTVSAEQASRQGLYEELTRGVRRFLQGLASWEALDSRQQSQIEETLTALPEQAERAFMGQHFALVAEYPEFMAWDNRRARGEMLAKLDSMNCEISTQLEHFSSSTNDLDVGLTALRTLVEAIRQDRHNATPQHAAVELNTLYTRSIERPVIVDSSRDENDDLVYPTKAEAYVPQSFKAAKAAGKLSNLEDERFWHSLEEQQDIGAFIVGYLQSPESIESPLLLLGQPGSGKSLLTEMLAARLAPPAFNTVRVPLRDVHPDDTLQVQIESRIKTDIGRSVDWASFAAASTETPPLVILDGFDELLQATGRVFGTYLQKIADFQRRERDLGRPLRVIITSRVSLIDRARVPAGSTVVRLQEFDVDRRSKWAQVWNSSNQEYFTRSKTKPFRVPTEPGLLHLAQQPLLLLMLAVYDSQGNALASNEAISRTSLYRNLLARFLRRERNKGDAADAFNSLSEQDQEKLIEQDLSRLGVAAVGMFNRQAVHIHRDQLDADITFFGTKIGMEVEGGVALGEADLLLGSFFFIHEAKATAGEVYADDRPAAFEFLHNTFGEFLTADFILRHLLVKLTLLSKLAADPSFATVFHNGLETITPQLLACLTHTSLASRPVILSMLTEWVDARRETVGLSQQAFTDALDSFISAQLRQTISDQQPPNLADGSNFVALPALGAMATYSLNLVLMRTLLTGDPFAWDDRKFPAEDGVSAWERLTHLWRCWFPLEALGEVAAIIRTDLVEDNPVLSQVAPHAGEMATTRLQMVADVADVLADSITAGLAELALWDEARDEADISPSALDLAFKKLAFSGMRLNTSMQIRRSWTDPVDSRVPLQSPAGPSTFINRLNASRDSLSRFFAVRRRLTPSQWSIKNPERLGQQAISALLKLNNQVEPRFIHHILTELDREWPSVASHLSEDQVEPLLTVALQYWHQPAVRNIVQQISDGMPTSVDNLTSTRMLASIAILAARHNFEHVETRCLQAVADAEGENGLGWFDLSLEQVDDIITVLIARRGDFSASHLAVCERLLHGFMASPEVGHSVAPFVLSMRMRELQKTYSDLLGPAASAKGRNLDPISGLYAVSSQDLPSALVMLHRAGSVDELRTMFGRHRRGVQRRPIIGYLAEVRDGWHKRALSSEELAAFAWAIDVLRTPRKTMGPKGTPT